jgi:hypothetical protein
MASSDAFGSHRRLPGIGQGIGLIAFDQREKIDNSMGAQEPFARSGDRECSSPLEGWSSQ